jgi:hypothetical protein
VFAPTIEKLVCASFLVPVALTLALGCEPTTVPKPGGQPGNPPRISAVPRALLLGDSIMDEHGHHARLALKELGISSHVAARWGSSLFTRSQYDCGSVQPDPEDGRFSWLAEARRLVAEFDPDIAVVYLNHNYGPEPPRTAEQCSTPEDDAIAFASPQFTDLSRTLLTELVARLRSRGARVYLVKPLPIHPSEPATANPIWQSYLTLKEELGLGVIDAGDAVADGATGGRIESMPDCFGAEKRVRPENDAHLTYFGAGLMGGALARAIANELGVPARGVSAPADDGAAIVAAGTGYRLVTCDAALFSFGNGASGIGADALAVPRGEARPVTAAASTKSGLGYSVLRSTGHVTAFGDAPDFGSVTPELSAQDAARGIAFTPSGGGYWIATSQGQVHAFGDAPRLGDLRGTSPRVVGIAANSGCGGYWLVTDVGRVHAFGTTSHFGDLGAQKLERPIVGIAANAAGSGYWLLDEGGRVFAFGGAAHYGNASERHLERLLDYSKQVTEVVETTALAVGMSPTPSGGGYRVFLRNGAVCHFGDAERFGSVYRTEINQMVVWLGEPYYRFDSPCQ